MSSLHRIEFTKIEDDSATIKIFAVHPDADRFPLSKDYLLQTLISYWDDLRSGYDFDFTNLNLSKAEMQRAAANFVKKNEFEKWYVLMRGEEKEISKEEYESISLSGYGYNPPPEAFAGKERNEKLLADRLGGRISRGFARRANFDEPMFYGVGLYPDTGKFVEIAEKIIVSRTFGASREYKNFSKSTQSYGFQTVAFKVSEAVFLSHLQQGASFEVANVAFRRS